MGSYQGRGLHGQVVEQMGLRIVGGAYPEGAPLFSEQLEREFDVSKTVVREALKVLAAKGLVESRQKRGTVIRPRDAWNLLDADVLRWQGRESPNFVFLENLAEVRGIVEPAAARLAAERRTDEDLAELETALAAMSQARQTPDAMVAADLRFHRGLLDAAHNEVLSRMEVILAAGLQVRDRFVHHSAHGSDPMPAHQALLDAIRDRDSAAAGRTVETLLAQAATDLAQVRRHAEANGDVDGTGAATRNGAAVTAPPRPVRRRTPRTATAATTATATPSPAPTDAES
ncbi:MAG: FadR/GntR family transcriptional regulator [Actinocrinis sp.]